MRTTRSEIFEFLDEVLESGNLVVAPPFEDKLGNSLPRSSFSNYLTAFNRENKCKIKSFSAAGGKIICYNQDAKTNQGEQK